MKAVLVGVVVTVVAVTAGGGKGCGCWGENKIYLQKEVPITGWYHRSSTNPYDYKRSFYFIRDSRRVDVIFLLRYNPNGHWVLTDNTKTSVKVISSNRRRLQLNVLCPGRCACRRVHVRTNQSNECWAIQGYYTRKDEEVLPPTTSTPYQNNTTPPPPAPPTTTSIPHQNNTTPALPPTTTSTPHQNNTTPVPQQASNTSEARTRETRSLMSTLKQSNCLLNSLAQCLKREVNGETRETEKVQNGCHEYTSVLSPSSELPTTKYIMNGTGKKTYTLTSRENGDFWWIVWEKAVYAVSSEGGPCPDQLPQGTKWQLASSKHPIERLTKEQCSIDGDPITVTCSEVDALTEG